MTAHSTPSGISERSAAIAAASFGVEGGTIGRWWRLAGGVLMTLALGTLYAWSVFVAPLENEFGWKRSQTSAVFTFAAVVFAAALLLGGRLQDRFGPFWIAVAGSLLFTFSFLLFSRISSLHGLYFIYSVLGGMGTGFGYGVVVPVMAKWFPDRTGLAIGLALAGFGSGSAVFGTFANLVLFPRFGWRNSCVILAAIFFVMTMTGASLLKNPATGRLVTGGTPAFNTATGIRQFKPGEVLRMPTFYLLWLGFGFGSTAGLMVISQLIPFANGQGVSSAALATLGLVVGAGGNVSGRVLSGWLSDLLGRLNTLRVVLALSAAAMPALYWAGAHLAALYVLIFAVYFGYGAQASVIPATVADFWGTRYSGSNYGSIFTAWGFSGILGPTIGGVLFDRYKNYAAAFYTAAALAAVALICVIAAKRPSAT
ncbi:MAG TPA: MFS transporter [Verrucomicrobiae bacterium]|jgi:OFA family oxalate/formate antiporter-like MFS transporter|nr:MFS transporter [Verrucomicrobiae bacterium]